MRATEDQVIARWARFGAGFHVVPARRTSDLERLLLDTARLASGESRLFIMAVTWLSVYGMAVARHRLARLAVSELEGDYRPVLGLMLSFAAEGVGAGADGARGVGSHFGGVLRRLSPAIPSRPLFAVDRQSEELVERSRRRASALSKQWGLWCESLELKRDAIRTSGWIVEHNAGFRLRCDFKGDLRASVMAALQHDEGAGASEMALARACGATRAAIRAALADLERSSRVVRRKGRRSTTIGVSGRDAA